MSADKLKAVFFDLDETLIKNKVPVSELFGYLYQDFQAQLGEDQRGVFFDTLRMRASALWTEMFDHPQSPEVQFVHCFEACIKATGSVAPERSRSLAQDMFTGFVDLSSNNVILHSDALGTLRDLSNRGFTTGIITNGIEQVQLGKIKSLGLDDCVDHLTVSAQARAHKPDLAVFELALTRAAVTPHQAWQVGDHALNDVAGAIRAGMGGIYYDPIGDQHSLAFAGIAESPTHVVNSLSEIVVLADQ